MCTFYRKPKKDSFIGYKIVIKIAGEYYSPATGLKYPLDGSPIPVLKEARRLVTCYVRMTDPDNSAYNKDMVGRTAVFLSLKDARQEKGWLKEWTRVISYGLKILRVKISNDLLVGRYGTSEIVAGRVMEIMDEIEEDYCEAEEDDFITT